ncbi:MAG: hypothetical protein HYV95_05935 [Opitutae bacterium]|nr:hypothetical protein [Opitutae bacterium]
MHTLPKFLAVTAALSVLLAPQALAQRQLGKKKGPTSKLYLAETKGEGKIITEDQAYEPRQATAFDAPGTVIETGNGSYQALVYSNGTGMYVDSNTRVEIARFVQEPFQPDRNTTELEPSISQSDVFVARGQIGLCTGQLVSGTTMNYSTPHAAVNIRSGRLVIETSLESSTVYLLDGDATVRSGNRDPGGQVLHPGEQAVIRPGPPGQPSTITIGPIDRQLTNTLDEKVSIACNARKTVSFEMIERKAEQGAGGPGDRGVAETGAGPERTETGSATDEIVARPTVPVAPPTNITVSPDRLNRGPGGH